MKSNSNNQKFYWSYRNWYSHQVVVMSPNNSAAVTLLRKLQGHKVVLDEAFMAAIDNINAYHAPNILNLIMPPIVVAIRFASGMVSLYGDPLTKKGN